MTQSDPYMRLRDSLGPVLDSVIPLRDSRGLPSQMQSLAADLVNSLEKMRAYLLSQSQLSQLLMEPSQLSVDDDEPDGWKFQYAEPKK